MARLPQGVRVERDRLPNGEWRERYFHVFPTETTPEGKQTRPRVTGKTVEEVLRKWKERDHDTAQGVAYTQDTVSVYLDQWVTFKASRSTTCPRQARTRAAWTSCGARCASISSQPDLQVA